MEEQNGQVISLTSSEEELFSLFRNARFVFDEKHFPKNTSHFGNKRFFFRFHFDSSPKNMANYEAFFLSFFKIQTQTLKLLGVSKSEAISEAVRC